MFWYLIICGLLTLVYILKVSLNSRGIRFSGVAPCILILWFFSFARDYTVGADTKNYVALVEQLKNFSFTQLYEGYIYNWAGRYIIDWEYGFRLVVWILSKTVGLISTRMVIACYSLITLIFLGKAVTRQSSFPMLSIWLYVTLCFFQTSLNMSRNAMAIAIILWGLKYVKERSLIKWLGVICVASSIHNSSWLFLPVYWIGNIEFNERKTVLTLIIAGIVYITYDQLYENIIGYVPTQYSTYLDVNESASSELMVLLLHICLIAAVVIQGKIGAFDKKRRLKEKSMRKDSVLYVQPYYTIFILEVMGYILSLYSKGLLRVATLYSPAIILYIPSLIESAKTNIGKKELQISIIIISLIGYILRMGINNIGMTQPYIFHHL